MRELALESSEGPRPRPGACFAAAVLESAVVGRLSSLLIESAVVGRLSGEGAGGGATAGEGVRREADGAAAGPITASATSSSPTTLSAAAAVAGASEATDGARRAIEPSFEP